MNKILVIWITCLLLGLIGGIINYKLRKIDIFWSVLAGIIIALYLTFKN
jgi:hypothetical protein